MIRGRYSAHPSSIGRRLFAGAGCSAVLLLIGACGSPPVSHSDRRTTSGQVGRIAVSQFRVLAPPAGSYAAGGVALADLTVANRGRTRDELISARSPDAGAVQLLRFGEQQAQAVLESGGVRTDGVLLQLTDLRRTLSAGDRVPITVTFRDAGDLTLTVPVQRSATS